MRTAFVCFVLAIAAGPLTLTAQWAQTAGQLPDVVTAMHSAGGNLYAGVATRGVYVSTDNGDSWNAVNEGLNDSDVVALYSFQGMLFAGTLGGGVFRTSIPPTGWQAVNEGLIYRNIMCFAGLGSYLYAGGYSEGIYRSHQLGMQWEHKGLGTWVRAIALDPYRVYVATRDRVETSTDWGETWESRPSTPYRYYNSLVLLGEEIYAGTGGYFAFRSTDGGATWTETSSGLGSQYINCLVGQSDHVFAGTTGGAGVYRFTYHGSEWTGYPEGFLQKDVWELEVHGTSLFAFERYTGLWRRQLSDFPTCAGESAGPWPHDLTLDQNYPNPFNPRTTIRYSLPAAAHVTLTLHDLLGRTVEVLADGHREAGPQRVELDASALASGVYVCRLEAGGEMRTRRLLVLR